MLRIILLTFVILYVTHGMGGSNEDELNKAKRMKRMELSDWLALSENTLRETCADLEINPRGRRDHLAVRIFQHFNPPSLFEDQFETDDLNTNKNQRVDRQLGKTFKYLQQIKQKKEIRKIRGLAKKLCNLQLWK